MLGKTLTGRYKVVKQLGGGGFSHTFIAEDGYLPDRPSCVIKQLKPASSQADILRISRELFDKEAKVLYRLGKHDCIPSLLAHFEEDEEFFLAQELIEGNVLTQEVRAGQRLGEQYTIDFLMDILPTLDFVHRQQVIHRDIKPSNLIRREADHKIVLIDFGAVKEVRTQPISQLGHTSSLVIGSPGYMPNEQYSGKTMFASDIYAVGMIALQCLTGLAPSQMPEDPITSEFRWHDLAYVTPTLANIIDKMVRFDFRQRYQSAKEVLEALNPLLSRSQANTIVSKVIPSLVDVSEELGLASEQSKSFVDVLIDGVSDDLEMSEDPIRAKKLICLVCTGILENDLDRLNNFSFVELLQDLYQQFPTIETMKENLVKAVKTIAVQKQRQYLVVAKFVFNAVSKIYPQSPRSKVSESSKSSPNNAVGHSVAEMAAISPVYQVSHLVINAGSAQLVAPLDTPPPLPPEAYGEIVAPKAPEEQIPVETYPNEEDDIYIWVANDIDTDAQQMRLKKLLYFTYQDIWESDLRLLNSLNWAELLRELVSFMPTFPQLMALIKEAVQRVSKPKEYMTIGNLLLTKLEPLYPDHGNFSQVEAIATSSVAFYPETEHPNVVTPVKIPFDPQIASNLFDQRLELMRFTNSMRAKIVLFSVLYYRFDPDRDNWQELCSHSLDSLLRQLFYAYSSFDKVESIIWQTARSFNESSYEQSASYILQAIKTLYDQLVAKFMLHPAEGSLSSSGDSEFTQPNMIVYPSSDDDTCQFV
ncbi:serine/threonine protein kinase [Pseudanabaena biceps]|nr:serine/threonine protein kinase [Pseudanabaena biceps]